MWKDLTAQTPEMRTGVLQAESQGMLVLTSPGSGLLPWRRGATPASLVWKVCIPPFWKWAYPHHHPFRVVAMERTNVFVPFLS